MSNLRVVILATFPLIREGLRALLADERDLEVTTLAPSDELIEDLLVQAPDVLLADVQVLEREGWDLLAEFRRALPACTLLVVSDDGNDRRVTRAVAAGVRGYVTRDASADEMAQAIRAARSGLLVLDPDIAQALVQTVRQPSGSDLADDELALIEPLSERELDVLRLMTRGRSNKQIAAELSISEHTVKFHIRAILGKLGAANRTAAVTLALQKGLVSL